MFEQITKKRGIIELVIGKLKKIIFYIINKSLRFFRLGGYVWK